MAVGAAIVLVAAAIVRGDLTLHLHRTAVLSILVLALVSTVAAFIGFLRGLRVLGPVRTAIISTVEPFLTALLAALVLGQPLTRRTLFGGVLIATAMLLLQRRRASPPKAD